MTSLSPGELNLIMQGTNPTCAHAWWLIPCPFLYSVRMTLMRAVGWHIIAAKYVLGPGDQVLVPSGLIVYDLARSN